MDTKPDLGVNEVITLKFLDQNGDVRTYQHHYRRMIDSYCWLTFTGGWLGGLYLIIIVLIIIVV